MKIIIPFCTLIIITCSATAQTKQVVDKQIDTTALKLDVYYPPDYDSRNVYPAIVFFFGGGWNGGGIQQFVPHAEYFSQRGLICFLADYRVKNRQQTTPFESLKDAKSAIRYIRKNAKEYSVDASKIIAAGEHLAAATAVVKIYNEQSDDLSISCKPNALILFNPVIDNGPGGYGYERIGDQYKDFSPLHNIKSGTPPTIFLLGTDDNLIPVETAEYYKTVMGKVGSRCDLYLYEREGHGFFNHNRGDNYSKTVLAADLFLQSLGYLKKEPQIPINSKKLLRSLRLTFYMVQQPKVILIWTQS